MWLGLLDEAGPGSSLQSGTRTSEGPRGRGVRLVELDIATTVGTRGARSRRAQEVEPAAALRGRVIEDHVGSGLPQPDVELVIDTGFPRVSGPHDEVDVTEQVRRGRTTNETCTDRPALGGGARAILQVCRDAGPVDVQARAVVDVLQMPPGRRTVLAAPADAEVRLVAVEEDEAAAGQEVALPGKRGAAGEQQRQRRQLSCNFTHFYSSISAEHSMYCSRAKKDFLLKKLLMVLPVRVTEFPRPRTRSPHRPRRKPWREGRSPWCWPAKPP